MPSGSKRRKAAKKKIRKDDRNGKTAASANQSQENEESKSHDERDSDGGEIEREEEDEKRELAEEGHVDHEEVPGGKEDVVDVVSEVNPEVVVFDVVEETSYAGNGVSANEVAVDEEQLVVEEVVELLEDFAGATEVASVEEVSDAVEERVAEVESVKELIPFPEEVNAVPESSPVESLVISDVVEAVFRENGTEALQILDEKEEVLIDLQPEKVDEEVILIAAERENEDKAPEAEAEPAGDSSVVDVVNELEPHEEMKEQISASVVDTSLGEDYIEGLKAGEQSEEVVVKNIAVDVEDLKIADEPELQLSAPAIDSIHGDDVKELKINEHSEEQIVAPAADSVRGDDIKNLKIDERFEEKVVAPAVDSVHRDDVKNLKIDERYEEQDHKADQVKDLEAPRNSEAQPLISAAPRAVQRTSLMNCCGLFELFSGSSR